MIVATSMRLAGRAVGQDRRRLGELRESGGLPPSMRVFSTVSLLEPMLSIWILMPVAAAKSATAEAKADAFTTDPLGLDGDRLALERRRICE